MKTLRFKEFKQVVPGHTTSKEVEADLVPGHMLIRALSPHCVMLAKRTLHTAMQLPVPTLIPPRRKQGVGGAGVRCKDPQQDTWI